MSDTHQVRAKLSDEEITQAVRDTLGPKEADRLQRNLERLGLGDGRVLKGFVARADIGRPGRAVHWSQAVTTTDGEDQHLLPERHLEKIRKVRAAKEAAMAQRLFEDLPPVRKLTTAEKLQMLTKAMIFELERTMRLKGRPELPRSIVARIAAEYRAAGAKEVTTELLLDQIGRSELVQSIAASYLAQAEREAK